MQIKKKIYIENIIKFIYIIACTAHKRLPFKILYVGFKFPININETFLSDFRYLSTFYTEKTYFSLLHINKKVMFLQNKMFLIILSVV